MKFDKIIATGGIGTGMLFLSSRQEALGRSESRPVTLSPAKDYCKQQIVLYYAAVLLKDTIPVYPVGYVGADSSGRAIIEEMRKQGMDVKHISQSPDFPTTISICLQYPDRETCNFTADNSASGLVTPEYIKEAMAQIGVDEKTIVCAIPEVPVASRTEMVRSGKMQGALTVLSVPVSEAEEFEALSIYRHVDILAVNLEEAQAVAHSRETGTKLLWQLADKLAKSNPCLSILMTCGKEGAYTLVGQTVERIPPLPGNAINTTGAGDAFLGGTLAGIARGMNLQKGRSDRVFGESALSSAPELGTICAGMAVECEDSIAFHVSPLTIQKLIHKKGWAAGEHFIKQAGRMG